MTRGSILIVARNNVALTKKAVASANLQDFPCDVMVINNASSDGTLRWLKAKSRIICTTFTDKQSLAYCWNTGLESFFLSGSKEVLVLNNDVEIRGDMYSRLLAVDKPFITGVSVRDENKRRAGSGELTLSPHPDFSCFMIYRSVFRTVGPFDEKFYPAFYEDNDYHVRMHRAGIKALSCNIPFLHHGSATVTNADEAERASIRRGAAACKERFRCKYNCIPGTPEYDALFT